MIAIPPGEVRAEPGLIHEQESRYQFIHVTELRRRAPHRYHSGRRIERAKALLAKPDYSVTEIGMAVGFSETSSFTAAFRKATGLTPTAYHRSLGQ